MLRRLHAPVDDNRDSKSSYRGRRTILTSFDLVRIAMAGSGMPLNMLLLTTEYEAMSGNNSLDPICSGLSNE